MSIALPHDRLPARHVPLSALFPFAPVYVILALFTAIIVVGAARLPGGFDGSGGLTSSLALLVLLLMMGLGVRLREPGSAIAAGLETVALFLMLSLLGALAASSLAIGGGPYRDDALIALDRLFFPAFDWQQVALALPAYPRIYAILNHAYGSLTWQPFACILLATALGERAQLTRFAGAWAIGLAICILPFHWLPCRSPFNHYGIGQDAVPGHQIGLPWDFLPVLESMRDGSASALTMANLTGLITMPSFHACGATILACAFWHYRWLRWPMLALNAGMAIAAVPIGSHYLVDIVAGCIAGGAAWLASDWWSGRQTSPLVPPRVSP